MKRKAKMVKQSEKENEEVATTSNNTKSPRKQQRPVHNNNNNNNNNSKPNAASPVRAKKSRDFTVDIFTPKSSEAKNEEEKVKKEEKEVEEAKKVTGSSTAAEKVQLSLVIVTGIVLFSGGVNTANLILGTI